MQNMKKLVSLLLVAVMVLGLLPVMAFATGEDMVYISVSYDSQYITDKDGGYIAHVGIPYADIAAIDLDAYGLGEYLYDEDGDGSYETTAMQLVIYAHVNLYGGDWSEVTVSGSPGSSYFEGGIFGFTENLNYYLNGEYPLASAGWGATSDQIVLEPGDYLNIGSFSSWNFYSDTGYGFHFFADSEGTFTHSYTVEAGTELPIKLVRSFSGMGSGAEVFDEAGYTVSYGSALYDATGTLTTDDSGCAAVTFDTAGTYYLWCDGGYGYEYPTDIVSTPAYAEVTVTAQEEEAPRQAQDVSAVLDATMAQLAATVTEPTFGTSAGEWTVLSLARGGYYAKDNAYFTGYYQRIVDTVNETAASVDQNGALHSTKSTENSRLIVALSSIGKNATAVGDWNLIAPYEDFSWIKKQGLNGTIWALIALDSNDYATTDTTIRQQCVDAIVAAQHDDGGWSLMANTALASDPDVTGMALTALYPYRDQEAVAAACAEAFACLSNIQQESGGFVSGGDENAESCAQVIVACATWGINPDTDSRFIKNGNSAVDALLAHYLDGQGEFQHIVGAGANAMATDQACYALVAYDRLMNSQPALYDYSDVEFDEIPVSDEMTATLGLPAEVGAGEAFNGVISINKWDNEGAYKLVDFIVSVPEGVSVTGVTAGERLAGGQISYHLEEATGKLRVVYFDANENADLTVSGEEFPAELFTIAFQTGTDADSKLSIAIAGMSVKLHSDSYDEEAMIEVNTDSASGVVDVVEGISFSAVCLYEGDDVDLIPSTKKAVAVAVTGIANGTKLTYSDGTNEIPFMYSAQITEKTGVSSYVALVDATIETEQFADQQNFVFSGDAGELTFGDTNADGLINAQDALAAVDAWLRKGEELTDEDILILNVNGDSRINTFDALGIVEAFINSVDFGVVTKAATITTKQ